MTPQALSTPAAPGAEAFGLSAARRWTRARAAFTTLHLLTWVTAVAQGFIDPDYDNLVCTLFVLCSASATFYYVRRTGALREVPLSTAAVLGLCMTTQWGALVGQSLLRDSLTASLRVPLQTFGYLLGFQLVAVAAHWVSRHLSVTQAARRVGARLLEPLGVFRVPRVQALWVMGVVGFGSIVVAGGENAGLTGKVAAAFNPLTWAPFVIPLLRATHGEQYCRMRRQAPLLALYAGAAILLGLALNARSLMLVGTMTAAVLYFIALLEDDRPLGARQIRTAAVFLAACALLYQPMSYFMLAVQAARVERGHLTQWQMIGYTFQVLQDPAAVRKEELRNEVAAEVEAYDEYYFKSAMIGRLVEIKFHDNAFYMVQGVSPVESRLIAEDALDRLWSILPYPVLRALDMGRAKFVTLYSVGDLLAYLRLGTDLSGYRTGSIYAQGIAIFGPWAPFLYFLLCVPIFVAWDTLSRPGSARGPAVVSVVGMLLFYRLYTNGIVAESVTAVASSLLRNLLQTALFYALVFALTRIVWRPFDASTKPGVHPAGSPMAASRTEPV